MTLDIPFALAFTAGMVATVNPCGFALLPAYIGFFVASDDDGREGARSRLDDLSRSLWVSVVMTAGFVTVFGIVGVVVSLIFRGLEDQLSKITVVIGFVLAALGIYLLTGHDLATKLPKVQKGGRDRGVKSMYLFGVSYATASLSCTLGPFLVAMTPTFRHGGVISGSLAYLAYSLGMGSVIAAITVATGLARGVVVAKLRSLLPLINRISGGLLLVAGAYVAWYGYWEINGDFRADPVVDRAQSIRDWANARVSALPRWLMFAMLVTGAIAIMTVRYVQRRTRRSKGEV